MSQDKLYLTKAQELADRLIWAFDKEAGVPLSKVNFRTGKASTFSWNKDSFLLAEVGSCQLEFAFLSAVTGNNTYIEKALGVYQRLADYPQRDGLFHESMDLKSKRVGKAGGRFGLGGLSDSFYEYLLKLPVLMHKITHASRSNSKGKELRQLLGRSPDVLKMYTDSTHGIRKHLIHRVGEIQPLSKVKNRVVKPQEVLMIGEMDMGGTMRGTMEHLTCFVPGMFALETVFAKEMLSSIPSEEWSESEEKILAAHGDHLTLARKLAAGCVLLYRKQPTGLAPETVQFRIPSENSKSTADSSSELFSVTAPKYILRPGRNLQLCVLCC